MRAIAYGAVAALTVTAASAEPDRKSANFMLPFCKTALAEAVGDVHVDTPTAAMGGLCLGGDLWRRLHARWLRRCFVRESAERRYY
jgi:hypothetical protein